MDKIPNGTGYASSITSTSKYDNIYKTSPAYPRDTERPQLVSEDGGMRGTKTPDCDHSNGFNKYHSYDHDKQPKQFTTYQSNRQKNSNQLASSKPTFPTYPPPHLRTFMSNASDSSDDEPVFKSKNNSFSPLKTYSGGFSSTSSWERPRFPNLDNIPIIRPPKSDIKPSHEEPMAADIFPRFESKRKRSYSSSSSDSETSSHMRKYRSNSTYSTKSGPVQGTFGRSAQTTPGFRRKFPNDEIDDVFKVKSETNSSAGSSPKREIEEEIRAPSPEQIKPHLMPRCRLERSAANKAQDLIRHLAPPRHTRGKSSSGEDDDSNEDGVPKYVVDMQLMRSLPSSTQMGYKLYAQIRNDSILRRDLHPFLESVDGSKHETKDYYSKIDKPMCLNRIEEKLANLDYFSTPEIVSDLRLILENCYKFNGKDAWISKLACKIEMNLEQKLSVLPYSMREKCALAETSPHLTLYREVCGRRSRTPRIFSGSSNTPIMLAMEELLLYREREAFTFKQQESVRKEEKILEDIGVLASYLTDNSEFRRICASWEFISSCVMICVCQESFKIAFTVSELELGLMYPQHSTYLTDLMLNLCCTPKALKECLRDAPKGKVSYEQWNIELQGRVQHWYHNVMKKGLRRAKTKFGITPQLFEVFGVCPKGRSPIRDVLFHQMSMKQRITLLYTLCSAKLESHPSLMNQFLEYEPDALRPTVLGTDTQSNNFFHFPLWPEEVRVYVELAPKNWNGTEPIIECVARNTDDLANIIRGFQQNGCIKLRSIIDTEKSVPSRDDLIQQRNLQVQLSFLYQTQVPHQAHHLLVETTVYKRLATSMFGQASLEPVKPPSTPPPRSMSDNDEDSDEDSVKIEDSDEDKTDSEDAGKSGEEEEIGLPGNEESEEEIEVPLVPINEESEGDEVEEKSEEVSGNEEVEEDGTSK